MEDLSPAVLLFSGGFKSTLLAADLVRQGVPLHLLTLNYGQPNLTEIKAAKSIAKKLSQFGQIQHEVERVGSPLEQPAVPVGSAAAPYTPGRNLLLAAVAVNRAIKVGADRIYFGCISHMSEFYPDNEKLYFDRLKHLVRLSFVHPLDPSPVHLEAPLIDQSYASLWEMAAALHQSWKELDLMKLLIEKTITGSDPNDQTLHPWGMGNPDAFGTRERAEGYAAAGL